MEKRGQLSIDFILAVVAFILLFVTLYTTILPHMDANYRIISAKSQARSIAINLAEIGASTQALSSGNYTIKHQTPRIYTTAGASQDCTITINSQRVLVNAKINVGDIYEPGEVVEIFEWVDFSGDSFDEDIVQCGEKITIKKE